MLKQNNKDSVKEFVQNSSYNCSHDAESSLRTDATAANATTTEDDTATDTTCYSVRHVIPAMVHKNADHNSNTHPITTSTSYPNKDRNNEHCCC